VFRPDVLLLDEPLGALDRNLREQMQVEVKRIHRDVGTTMVYVTHDQTEAMTMSDHVAVFSQRKLEQVAPPLDVYHRPAMRFVGEFVGDSNFLDGHYDAAGA
jgi:putative spermidine/putrescine transport system ATP-binding protein